MLRSLAASMQAQWKEKVLTYILKKYFNLVRHLHHRRSIRSVFKLHNRSFNPQGERQRFYPAG